MLILSNTGLKFYSDEKKYIKRVYNVMLRDLDFQPDKDNWASLVRQLLSRLGFMDVWLAQGVGSIAIFINIFKQRVKDIFSQEWHARLDNSSRARFYNQISSFNYQVYLDKLQVDKFRKSLCRLRLASHRLEIETGRWTKPIKTPLEDRKCKLCGILEDEYHFVFECSLYLELRKKYISKYYWKRPSMMKLIELFSSESTKQLQKLSVYTQKAFKLRQEHISV